MIDLSEAVTKDFIKLFASEQIGYGSSRRVFAQRFDKSVVIKIEDVAHSFQNVNEWLTWEDLKDTKQGKWLAPCVAISSCGTVLIQKRTTPLLKDPDLLPNFLTDTKRENYGMLGRQVVCHDYGLHRLNYIAQSHTRLIRPKWWSESI